MKTTSDAFALPRLSTLPAVVKTPVDSSVLDKFAAAEVAPIGPRAVAPGPTSKPEDVASKASVLLPEDGNSRGESRLIVSMPAELHRLLKVRCASRGITIRSYMLALLEADGLNG